MFLMLHSHYAAIGVYEQLTAADGSHVNGACQVDFNLLYCHAGSY